MQILRYGNYGAVRLMLICNYITEYYVYDNAHGYYLTTPWCQSDNWSDDEGSRSEHCQWRLWCWWWLVERIVMTVMMTTVTIIKVWFFPGETNNSSLLIRMCEINISIFIFWFSLNHKFSCYDFHLYFSSCSQYDRIFKSKKYVNKFGRIGFHVF